MQIATILHRTMTDGPGPRTSVYLQGCSIGRSATPCRGCQSRQLWPEAGGTAYTPARLAALLIGSSQPITFIGGEPMDQAVDLALCILAIRRAAPDRHIIVYSGYTLDELRARSDAAEHFAISLILHYADVLVDGRFVAEQDHAWLQFRGSANQRPIDLVATRARDCWDAPILLPWDERLTIQVVDGRVILPIGAARVVAGDGTVVRARRCGQVCRATEEGPRGPADA